MVTFRTRERCELPRRDKLAPHTVPRHGEARGEPGTVMMVRLVHVELKFTHYGRVDRGGLLEEGAHRERKVPNQSDAQLNRL